MPVFRITYTSERDNHAIKQELEWVTPNGWDADKTVKRFGEAHPHATITGFLQISKSCDS